MSDNNRSPTRSALPRYATRSTTIRLAEDLLDRIEEVRAREGMVQSDAIRYVLEVGLTRLGIKKKKESGTEWRK